MKPLIPYVDEDSQVIFVEIKNQVLHEFLNGLILALIIFLPLLAYNHWFGL